MLNGPVLIDETCCNGVMLGRRALALLLLLLAFLGLAASRAFPFLDDVPGVVKTVAACVAAACGLAGVGLWLRRPPGSEN
jgi:hypothetical protein